MSHSQVRSCDVRDIRTVTPDSAYPLARVVGVEGAVLIRGAVIEDLEIIARIYCKVATVSGLERNHIVLSFGSDCEGV